MKGRPWTNADLALLRAIYPNAGCREMERRLDRTIGAIYQKVAKLRLKRSAQFLAEKSARERRDLLRFGAAHRFHKGDVPQNKGKRRPGWSTGRMREGWFKKGQRRGVAALKYKPIGAIGECDGYLYIKIAEAKNPPYGFPNKQSWRMLHHKVWEDAGNPAVNFHTHCLIFKDGDRKNCSPENLQLITRAENCRRNSIHRLPPALKKVITLKGAIRRRITIIERKKRNGREKGNACRSEEHLVRDPATAQAG